AAGSRRDGLTSSVWGRDGTFACCGAEEWSGNADDPRAGNRWSGPRTRPSRTGTLLITSPQRIAAKSEQTRCFARQYVVAQSQGSRKVESASYRRLRHATTCREAQVPGAPKRVTP